MQMSVELPSIPELRRITQSLAMLDAILCPEWEYRYYSFNSKWAPDAEMASMRNGEGDDWFLLFDRAGAALKGFAHELAQGSSCAQQIQFDLPATFAPFLNEGAFSMHDATFCYWREANAASWNQVNAGLTDDGSALFLQHLVEGPKAYAAWAEIHFEVAIHIGAVKSIFAHQPLNDLLVLSLNPDADLEAVYSDTQEIGYLRAIAE